MEEKAKAVRPAHYTQVPEPDYSRNAINHKTDTLVYAMGGLGEVGKNMYCFEHDDEIIIVDCGVLFPEDELLGIDYVIPDMSYVMMNRNKLRGVVFTHGHEDHIGAVPYLLRQVSAPLYGTRLTLGLIANKLQEHGLRADANLIVPGDKVELGVVDRLDEITCRVFRIQRKKQCGGHVPSSQRPYHHRPTV